MTIEEFSKRLIELRSERDISARNMSLSIGLAENYINKIERNLFYPSMSVFFYICEFLGVTPKEFFDFEYSQNVDIKDSVDIKGTYGELINLPITCSPDVIEKLVETIGDYSDEQINLLIDFLNGIKEK